MDPTLRVVVCIMAIVFMVIPLNSANAKMENAGNINVGDITNWEVNYMASILAGETAPGCDQCHQWIACTLADDVARYKESGKSITALHPGRWNGFRANPSGEYIEIMQEALTGSLCNDAPDCRFIGNANDYRQYWTRYGDALITGNQNGLVVCVPMKAEYARTSYAVISDTVWERRLGRNDLDDKIK